MSRGLGDVYKRQDGGGDEKGAIFHYVSRVADEDRERNKSAEGTQPVNRQAQ